MEYFKDRIRTREARIGQLQRKLTNARLHRNFKAASNLQIQVAELVHRNRIDRNILAGYEELPARLVSATLPSEGSNEKMRRPGA